MTTLLLGMGNPILSDDAVGVRLAQDFARKLEGIPDLVIEPDCGAGGLNLLDVLEGHSRAVVLDAVKTTGARPGHWHAFDATALHETLHLTSVHDANFATALELGHRLGMALPAAADVHIFAIEVEDVCTFSERMTPALEDGYPVYSTAIFEEVRRILEESPPARNRPRAAQPR